MVTLARTLNAKTFTSHRVRCHWAWVFLSCSLKCHSVNKSLFLSGGKNIPQIKSLLKSPLYSETSSSTQMPTWILDQDFILWTSTKFYAKIPSPKWNTLISHETKRDFSSDVTHFHWYSLKYIKYIRDLYFHVLNCCYLNIEHHLLWSA